MFFVCSYKNALSDYTNEIYDRIIFLCLTEKQTKTNKQPHTHKKKIHYFKSFPLNISWWKIFRWILEKELLLCITDRSHQNTVCIISQWCFRVNFASLHTREKCVKGTPTWTFTFHCSFEEHFAAATGYHPIVAAWGLIPTHQTYLGRSWGSSRNTS